MAAQATAAGRGPGQERLLAALLSAIVAGMVLVPLAAVVVGSLGDEDGFSLDALASVLSSGRVIGNTVVVGLGTMIVATALGGLLALILVRTDTPWRGGLEHLVLLPLYVTPLLTAVAWSWLGSPRAGLINLAAQNGLGLPGPILNLHSAGGVVAVSGLAYAPLPFLLIAGALRGMDPSLEESARVHGASVRTAFRRVTLPLVLPALLGSALLVFVQSLGLFSVPAVLGMPAGFYVAATEIYRLLNTYPPRVTQAAGWGLLLLVATAVLVAAQALILRRRSYVTITGKAFRPRTVSVGRWRAALLAVVLLYVAAAVVLPVATLAWAALVNFVTVDPALMGFDLRHFRYVLFTYPKTLLATRNSLLLGVLTASLICLVGLAMAWVIVRSRGVSARFLDQVGMMPLAIPPIVLALGLLWSYVGLTWLPLYGTIGILLLAYATHYLPFGLRALTSAVRQLHPELEDAARVAGAGLFGTLRRIVLPLTLPTLVATWTLLFILSLQEISSSILLYTAPSTVLSVAVFDLWEAGNVSALSALSVMQLAVTFAALLLVARFRQRAVAA